MPQYPHNNMSNNPYNLNGMGPVQQHFQWRPNPGFRAPFPRNNRGSNHCGRWLEPEPRGRDEHWCETCDRGFPTLDQLEKHKLQHQKCNIDGCQFVAHPKVITKHIQMQHSSGLYKKIAKLDNPEAINKWREERKKKYPTKQNIDKKAAELKEKVERGEKMGLKPDRMNRNSNSVSGGTTRKYNVVPRQQQGNLKRNHLPGIHKKPKRELKSVPEIDNKSRLEPFSGIQNIIKDYETEEKEEDLPCNFLIEDDDCGAPSTNMSKTENISDTIICGALTSLICDYGSSDEEINKQLTKTSETSQLVKALEIVHNTATITNNDEDSGPEEVTITKNNSIADKLEKHTTEDKGKHGLMKKKKNYQHKVSSSRPKPKLPSTLLHKLLYKEMRQERNIVLQCIRYIKRNNFFDH